MSTLKTIWKNRKQILEGVRNKLFKKEHVEEIAAARLEICEACPHIDLEGGSCLISGTQPCCGKCGCSLELKLRSLSSPCGDEEVPRWHALLTPEEEDALLKDIEDE
jgi:hypothetical protein